jgi:hypothetical protein
MRPRNEYVTRITSFPKLSKAHRETAIQALADIFVADYKANQAVSSPTVKTSTLRNRSGDARNEPEKGSSKDSDS